MHSCSLFSSSLTLLDLHAFSFVRITRFSLLCTTRVPIHIYKTRTYPYIYMKNTHTSANTLTMFYFLSRYGGRTRRCLRLRVGGGKRDAGMFWMWNTYELWLHVQTVEGWLYTGWLAGSFVCLLVRSFVRFDEGWGT